MRKNKPFRISMQYFAEDAAQAESGTEPSHTEPATDPAADTSAPDTAAQLEQLTAANAALQQELDTLRQEHLSQEERTRLELAQRETDVANREAVIRERENRLYAIQALEKAQLVGGGITSADLLPFVTDSTTQGIDSKIKALQGLLDKHAKTQTEKIYQGAGRQPQQVRSEGADGTVPFFRTANAKAQAQAKEIRERYTGGKV